MDEQADHSAQAYFNAVLEYQSKALGNSAAYNQVIVFGAYAAFFALWSAVSEDLPKWVILWSTALMLVSVIVYVAWTVYGMMAVARFNKEMTQALAKGPDGFLARVQAVEGESIPRQAKVMRWWKLVVGAAAMPAGIAAILVAGSAIAQVTSLVFVCPSLTF